MKPSKFLLGFTFVMLGVAIGEGINYLDLRQLETQIPGGVFVGSMPSGASFVYQSLKSKNEFSKSFSPEISADLMRDYSTMDKVIKLEYQNIHHSVSQKKSEALQNMEMFLFLTVLGSLSAIRRSRKERV